MGRNHSVMFERELLISGTFCHSFFVKICLSKIQTYNIEDEVKYESNTFDLDLDPMALVFKLGLDMYGQDIFIYWK